MHPLRIVLACLTVALATSACSSTDAPAPSPLAPLRQRRVRPNVVLMVLDDVGFGQLGTFGGPVPTPSLDRLAKSGLRYTSFHTGGVDAASRAALLTGRTPPPNRVGEPVRLLGPTLADRLRPLGYAAYAVGGWLNTPPGHVSPKGPFDEWPTAHGFEHFYGFFGEEVNHWAPLLWFDRWPFDPAASVEGYRLDRDLSERAVELVREKDATGEPFFLYFAPGATHAPHHAPRAAIARNQGRFDRGWDVIRAETFERQKALGLVPRDAELAPRPDGIRAWDRLSEDEQRLFARMQEVHAASLELADAQLGRVLDELRDERMLDDTVVIVTSDDGASGEGGRLGTANTARLANGLPERLDLDAIDELGGPRAFNHYPAGWALADDTPGRSWKSSAHEGGTRTPFVISWPHGIAARGELRSQLVASSDVTPTVLELVGAAPVEDVDGASFAATLADASAPSPRATHTFASGPRRAIWAGGWKAVTSDGPRPWLPTAAGGEAERWELYDLDRDPGEAHDLARDAPERLTHLRALLAHELERRASRLAQPLASRSSARPERRVCEGLTRATPEARSVPVLGRSHAIVARVRVSPGGDLRGVIATCGGRFGGYSLYVKNGTLTYAHDYVGDARYVIEAKEPIHPGERVLRFDFESTGANEGHGRLFIDDVLVGEGEIPHTVPRLFSTSEPCDTGVDTGTAAGDYDAPFPFTGRLHEVTIELTESASLEEGSPRPRD